MKTDLIGFKRTQPTELVMNRMRASMGMFGVTPLPGIVSPDYAVLRPISEIVPRYYEYLFKTRAMCAVFRVESKGLGTGSSGFLRLYADQFGKIRVPAPPTSEQVSIVEHIRHATRAIVDAEAKIADELSALDEYRTRLVSDVVTGKLDVRGVALRQLEESEELSPPPGDMADEVSEEEQELEAVEETADAGD